MHRQFLDRPYESKNLLDLLKDPEGRGRTQEQVAQEFAANTSTQPDKAAEVIHRGVEAGKARILIGPDAQVFDALARVAPTRYYDLIERLQRAIQKRGAK